MSFRLKTVLGIALIEMLVMAVLIVINQFNLGGSASAQLYQRAQDTGRLMAGAVSDAVISYDLATLDATITNSLVNDEIIYVRVRDVEGERLSFAGEPSLKAEPFTPDQNFEDGATDGRIDIQAPIMVEGEPFGVVEIGVSTRNVEAEMTSALRWNIAIAAIGMGLVAAFGAILGSVLTRQLAHLREGAVKLASGDLNHRVVVRGQDELADTANCFNDMAETLRQERNSLEDKQLTLMDKTRRVEAIVGCMTRVSAGETVGRIPNIERQDEVGDMARATDVFQNAMREVQNARKRQSRLLQAIEHLEEQVAIFDSPGRVLFVNNAFRAQYEKVLEDLPERFTYPKFLKKAIDLGVYPDAADDPQSFFEMMIEAVDLPEPSEVRVAPETVLLQRARQVPHVGVVISAADITALRSSQAQLVQASKLATLGEMATGMAHELNQPLGVIRMAANNCAKRIAKNKADPEYLTGKLERIGDQCARAAEIIDHMRIFGRKSDDQSGPFQIDASMRNITTLMAKQLAVMGIVLEVDDSAGPAWTRGGEVMFEQVVLNLINNARDAIVSGFAEDADVSGAIRVGLRSEEDGWVVTVADTGGGVPEHVLDRLFDPFFTTKDPGKGTGLGLSIGYGIIQEMGGSITVANNDEGAVFTIVCPRVEVEAEAEMKLVS